MLNFLREPRLRRLRLCDLPKLQEAENPALLGAYRMGVPPLPAVAVREGGGIRVLMGAERIEAARAAGLRRVPVLLLPQGTLGLIYLWLLTGASADPFFRAKLLTEALRTAEKKQLAEILGLSASAITQRIRLLQLSPEMQAKAVSAGLSEGQLLELVKLPNTIRAEGLDEVISRGLSLQDTKKLVEAKLGRDTIKAHGRRRMVVKDGRIFQNTIRRSVELMQEAGLDALLQREQDGEFVEYRIRVPQSQLVSGVKKS